MPSNMILPNSGADGGSIHRRRSPAVVQVVTMRLIHIVLSTAAQATAVYMLALVARGKSAETVSVPGPHVVSQSSMDHGGSPWPMFNAQVLSYDLNLAGARTMQQNPALAVNEDADIDSRVQRAVLLLIALVDQLLQAAAIFLVRQQHQRRAASEINKQPTSETDSETSSFLSVPILLAAPMLALSSASTSAALSTVWLESSSLFYVPVISLRALTCLILDTVVANRPYRSGVGYVALVGVAGLCAFWAWLAQPATLCKLPVLAALSAVGPWLQHRFQFNSRTRMSQSLMSALMLVNLIHVVDGSFTCISTVTTSALVLHIVLSLGSALIVANLGRSDSLSSPSSSSLIDCAVSRRDAFAFLCLGVLGLNDTASSAWTRAAYLAVLGLHAFLNPQLIVISKDAWSEKSPPIDHSHTTTTTTTTVPIRTLVLLASLLACGTSISDMHAVLTRTEPSHSAFLSSAVGAVVNDNSNHHQRTLSPAHLTHANPNNLDPRYDFAGTLLVDPSLEEQTVHYGHKSARVFSLNATDSAMTNADDRVTFQVRVPTLDKWPERPWDVIAQKEAWLNKAFGRQHASWPHRDEAAKVETISMDHLAIGMAIMDPLSQAPAWLANVAFAAGTFAAAGQVDCQVFWSGDEDPIAIRGKHSYFVKSFQEMVKGTSIRGPVVMKGDPNVPSLSRDIMFFKMLPYLYLTSQPTTRWFLVGTDATVWFPSNVLAFLNTLPIDPLQVPAFFADPSPRTHSMAGGGMIVSHALARLVHEHVDQTCALAGMMETGKRASRGDEMLRECIGRIMRRLPEFTSWPTNRNSTTTGDSRSLSTMKQRQQQHHRQHHQVRILTRLPMFNSIDMHNTRDGIDLLALSGHSYLSARLSRAAPFTLHNLLALPPAQFGVYNRQYGAYKLWHLVSKLPRALQFRRFFIHLDPHHHGTAVVTYGLTVRVYEMKLEHLDHTVDLDNRDLPVDQVGGIEWVLDDKIEDEPIGIKDGSVDWHHESQWPRRHKDYEEYWLAEVDERENKMVYVCERIKRTFMLQVKCASQAAVSTKPYAESGPSMYHLSCPAVV